MTLEERAEEIWCYNYSDNADLALKDFKYGYIEGATEQKKIDIEKACEYIMTHPAYAVQPEVYAEGLKKAMMK